MEWNFFKRNKNKGLTANPSAIKTGEIPETKLEEVKGGVGTTPEEAEMVVEEQKKAAIFVDPIDNNLVQVGDPKNGYSYIDLGIPAPEPMTVEKREEMARRAARAREYDGPADFKKFQEWMNGTPEKSESELSSEQLEQVGTYAGTRVDGSRSDAMDEFEQKQQETIESFGEHTR